MSGSVWHERCKIGANFRDTNFRLYFAFMLCYVDPMVPRKKINLDAVLACLDKACPKCGYRITPDKIVRVDWKRQRCPACGEVFEARKKSGRTP